MNPRFLLDTHVCLNWLGNPRKLSREQVRLLTEASRRREAVGISAMTLVEIAIVFSGRIQPLKLTLDQAFTDLESNPFFQILPLSFEVAREVSYLAVLPDPGDRVIVATARAHGLRLLTADQRIIASNLVSVVE